MSRGPRDLRDLICVSRLTFRQSDEEVISDEDSDTRDWDDISVGSWSSESRQDSATVVKHTGFSPDSGFATNGGSPLNSTICNADTNLKLDLSILHEKKQSKKKKTKKKVLEIDRLKNPFPKPPPLPPLKPFTDSASENCIDANVQAMPLPDSHMKSVPIVAQYVGSKSVHISQSESKMKSHDKVARKKSHDSSDDIENSVTVKNESQQLNTNRQPIASHMESGSYDIMLSYMDATVVSNWLTRANESVSDISTYILKGDNFVQFAHFWLAEFEDVKKHEIFELEIEILRDELGFAFAVGKDEKKISQRDISNLIGAIFREYPVKLFNSKGNFLFLDYLDIITSIKTENYKKLLSDVKCSTQNRQYAQWLLATRSFALVNMWSAIVNFYRNLLAKKGQIGATSKTPPVLSTCKSVYDQRLYQALHHGFVDVVHYLHSCGLVNLRQIDNQGRTLVFTAVMYNQLKTLQYLVTRVKPPLDINHVSDSGNTALHAAVNNGSNQLVSVLLKSPNININCVNTQCENATPLHLAVMHGHFDVVELLLKAGTDTSLKMGDLTAVDIAREFEHPDILTLLQERK